jgi:hypothetical protein
MRTIHAAISGILAMGSWAATAGAQVSDHARPVTDPFRSALWQEDVGANLLYHNDGGGTRKFAFGTSSVSGNNYFVFQANHSGFFGMLVRSPQATAQPFYAYGAGSSGIANHWYTASNSSWNLAVDNEHSLQVDSNRDLHVIQGEVHADGYQLNSDRYLFARFAPWDFVSNPYLGGFVTRLDLPQGAEIVQFQATIESSGGTAIVELVRTPNGSLPAAIQLMGGVAASTTSTQQDTIIANPVVDNQNYAYHLLVSQPAGTLVRTVRVQYKVGEL